MDHKILEDYSRAAFNFILCPPPMTPKMTRWKGEKGESPNDFDLTPKPDSVGPKLRPPPRHPFNWIHKEINFSKHCAFFLNIKPWAMSSKQAVFCNIIHSASCGILQLHRQLGHRKSDCKQYRNISYFCTDSPASVNHSLLLKDRQVRETWPVRLQ
jgi:hypothetical protein